ncbi:hypothetical protein BGW41_006544 [Actinomortierella wolfii]|nr:hypothetical protein BGW41_006544 [Actinomortierella wolfii]
MAPSTRVDGDRVLSQQRGTAWKSPKTPKRTLRSTLLLSIRLNHQHIIQFHDAVYHDGDLARLTGFAEGKGLREAIDNGRIQDWPTKVRLAREISIGLAYIHSEDVLHMDLKSENVLLSTSMENLKTASVVESAGSQRETVRWMAPELFDQQSAYSTKSDVYSFGMVMWEMAANSTPLFKEYPGNDTVISLVKDGKRENLPDDTPADYRTWVEQCWNHDPTKRPEASEFTVDKGEVVDPNVAMTTKNHESTSTLDASLDTLSISTTPTKQGDKKSQSGQSTRKTLETSSGIEFCIIPQRIITIEGVRQGNQGGRARDSEGALSGSLQGYSWNDVTGQGIEQNDMEAVKWFAEAANQGHAEEQFCIGMMFMEGRSVEKCEATALEWFLRADGQGEVNAQCTIGILYADGLGVKQNIAESFKWLTKAANHGRTYAQWRLGMMYRYGEGIKQDDTEAVKWFTKAATQGLPAAQFNLGTIFLGGRGVGRSDFEAFKWFIMAAEREENNARSQADIMHNNDKDDKINAKVANKSQRNTHLNLGELPQDDRSISQSDVDLARWYTVADLEEYVHAQFTAGTMYHGGRGVKQNTMEAIKWYTKAADHGHTEAQCNLAEVYAESQGVENSNVEAVKWYRKAADLGHPDAQYNLGTMYHSGKGVEQNDVEAIKWYTRTACQGQKMAQLLLGAQYQAGRDVKQSDTEAIRWITHAANRDHADAQYVLGHRYLEGAGVKQSDKEALKWFIKAAQQGGALAQTQLGKMYQNGRGVESSDAEASKRFTEAANQGHADAQINLALMYSEGRGVKKNNANAIKWLTEAGKQDSTTAVFNLGMMYFQGLGVKQSYPDASKWFSMAANLGDKDA